MDCAEEAHAEGVPVAGAPSEAGQPDILEATATALPTSEEMGSQEPQVPDSLCAESAVDISESGGARGPEIPVASTSQAHAHSHRRSCSRGKSMEKSMRGEWLLT